MSYKFREHIKKNKYVTTCVSENKKIIFMRCGRVASTSITNLIGKFTEVSLPYFYENGTSDWLENITDEEIKNDYFVFTFVRNPFDRLVSAWKPFTKKYPPKVKLNFSNFVKKRGVGCLLYEDGSFTNDHWFPQSKYVEFDNGEKFVNFVGKFENLNRDWKIVANQLGLSENLYNNKKSNKNYKKYYTNELVEITSIIYQKDLEIFNYEF